MKDLINYRVVYPEIYYKVQPFIIMACDQLDTYSSELPSQEMVENMSDTISDNMSKMYPDMAEYMKSADDTTAVPTESMFGFDRDRFGSNFRRRGLFRDFVDILLLSELFRRRRRFY